jgi:hypothetical protein
MRTFGFLVLLLVGHGSATAFQTSFVKERSCNQSGQVDVLKNNDPSKAYRVTYNEKYQVGGQSGTTQQIAYVAAGGRTEIGCTNNGTNPPTYWQRTITGEVPAR